MSKIKLFFAVLALVCLLIMAEGCTSSTGTGSITTIPTSNVPPTPILPPPNASTSPTPAIIETTTVSTLAPTAVITNSPTIEMITPGSVDASGSDPMTSNLQFSKSFLSFPINNCDMQDLFPVVANDPTYGLTQSPPKIIGISEGEINTFIRENTEGKNSASKVISTAHCQGRPVDPQWNFVDVTATLTPRNARPSNYIIAVNVRKGGKVIGQLTTTEMLTIDQPDVFTTYIPLKVNEMDLFDSVDLVYKKIST